MAIYFNGISHHDKFIDASDREEAIAIHQQVLRGTRVNLDRYPGCRWHALKVDWFVEPEWHNQFGLREAVIVGHYYRRRPDNPTEIELVTLYNASPVSLAPDGPLRS